MAKCQKVRKKYRQYCAGDLKDDIIIENRSIAAPTAFESVDYDETFSNSIPVKSAINTVRGKTFFDSVGIGVEITHEIGIRFIDGVGAEQWVTYKGDRLDILRVENLDERSKFLRLTCVNRGQLAKNASKA